MGTNNTLPVIEHATTFFNANGRVVIQMDEGWVFWDENMYRNYTDENGNVIPPLPEDISYFRRYTYSPNTDFSKIHPVDETTVPADQIFGTGNNHETI